jgi:hypothetical protein
VWSFSKNKAAAKSLITFLSQRSSAEQTVAASHGYDLPPYANLLDFKTWETEAPPLGTLYSYPPRYADQIVNIANAPAPKKIANQIYSQATMSKIERDDRPGDRLGRAGNRRLYAQLRGMRRTASASFRRLKVQTRRGRLAAPVFVLRVSQITPFIHA